MALMTIFILLCSSFWNTPVNNINIWALVKQKITSTFIVSCFKGLIMFLNFVEDFTKLLSLLRTKSLNYFITLGYCSISLGALSRNNNIEETYFKKWLFWIWDLWIFVKSSYHDGHPLKNEEEKLNLMHHLLVLRRYLLQVTIPTIGCLSKLHNLSWA